jgi:hypothetical protein
MFSSTKREDEKIQTNYKCIEVIRINSAYRRTCSTHMRLPLYLTVGLEVITLCVVLVSSRLAYSEF